MNEYRSTLTGGASVDGNSISGIAVPYGKSSVLLNDRPRPYRERFAPGSFPDIGDHVSLFVGHDHRSLPLARVGSGTLSFEETPEGLRFKATLPESRSDVLEAVKRGDVGGVSIGFNSIEDDWQHRSNKMPSDRTVSKANLFELSLVASGAYPDALID